MNTNNSSDILSNKPSLERGVALIVDDEITNRLILASLLNELGFFVFEASNGSEAVLIYAENRPDIVFMDVMMPVMNGFEATKRIKAMSDGKYVPVIFITSSSDEATLMQCINCGGDDFVTKPFSHTLLNARILAHERTRNQNHLINSLYDKISEEEDLAEHVYKQSVDSNSSATDIIQSFVQPMGRFSGDIWLTTHTPNNEVYIMLGDFTGHGLAAALGGLLISDTFSKMGQGGYSLEVILAELNDKLCRLLPTHMFMGIQIVSINYDLNHVKICNCGMPNILHISTHPYKIINKVRSSGLPLGIISGVDFRSQIVQLPITRGDHILLVSDGILESRDESGNMYGQDRFERKVTNMDHGQSLVKLIATSLEAFTQGAPQEDDYSLLDIPCIPAILPVWSLFVDDEKTWSNSNVAATTTSTSVEFNKFGFRIELEGACLQKAEPVPLIIREIKSMMDIGSQDQPLFVILTELYNNALDHGILKMDSNMKNSVEGFTCYFEERERRLLGPIQGSVIVDVTIYNYPQQTKIIVILTDSGLGFDYQSSINTRPSITALHGRGIMLVKELCDSLDYRGNGNQVEAVYSWSRRCDDQPI